MGAEERGIEALSAFTVIAKRLKTNPFGYCRNKTFSDKLIMNNFFYSSILTCPRGENMKRITAIAILSLFFTSNVFAQAGAAGAAGGTGGGAAGAGAAGAGTGAAGAGAAGAGAAGAGAGAAAAGAGAAAGGAAAVGAAAAGLSTAAMVGIAAAAVAVGVAASNSSDTAGTTGTR